MIEKRVRELISDEVFKLGVTIDSVVYEKEGSNDKIFDALLNCEPKSLLKKHFYDLS